MDGSDTEIEYKLVVAITINDNMNNVSATIHMDQEQIVTFIKRLSDLATNMIGTQR